MQIIINMGKGMEGRPPEYSVENVIFAYLRMNLLSSILEMHFNLDTED